MAFAKLNFKTTYSPGDLFYGLDGSACNYARTKLINQLCNGMNNTHLNKINNYAVTANEVSGKRCLSNEENAFRKVLSGHEKYHTSVDWGPDNGMPKTWLQNKNNGVLPKNYGLSAEEKLEFEVEQNSAWRRKCKGGLYYACFVAKIHVHFCLEAFNFDMVINKSALGFGDSSYPFEGLKQRAVTNAELRWVYRHREFNEVSEYIQFWKKEGSVFVPCTPPWSWSVGGGDWAQYKPKNVTWGLAGMRMMEENFKKLLHKNENLRKYYEWLES